MWTCLYTLLKSDVTRRDHVVHCHGSQECWFTLCQFRCQFHSRRHSLRITLKSTKFVHMRSRYAWTMKSWQRSEWRLDLNSVYRVIEDFSFLIIHVLSCMNIINGNDFYLYMHGAGESSSERPVPGVRPPNFNQALHFQSGTSSPDHKTTIYM